MLWLATASVIMRPITRIATMMALTVVGQISIKIFVTVIIKNTTD